MPRSSTLLATVGLALVSTGVSAQAQLEEIIVSARKQDERLQDVPLSVSAFSGDALIESGARDMLDVSRMTPGFSFEKINRYGVRGGSARPVIRGMSSIQGEGNASVFVDGILFSDSILSFPMDIVERVEVIKGPQAALFGRATFSGAINLITKKGSNESENKVSLRAAEFGDYEANVLSRGALIEDKLFFMAHTRVYSFDGFYRNSLDGKKVGGEESVNVNGSIEYRPTESFSAIVNAGYTRDRDDMAAIALQDRFYNNCYLGAARQYYCGALQEAGSATLDRAGLQGTDGLNRDSTRIAAQLTWDLANNFQLISNSGAFFTQSEYGYDSTYQGATAIDAIGVPGAPGYTRPLTDPVRNGNVMRNEVIDSENFSTELRLVSDRNARLRFMGGLFYYQSEREFVEDHFLPTAPTVDSGNSQVKNWAVFSSLAFDLTDRWEITGELRYSEDKVSNVSIANGDIGKTFESVSPRITSTYKLTPDNMVYVNVAKGNKPGVVNADPRFPDDVRFADEETTWNYEIGSKNTLLDGSLMLNLAVFQIDWQDQGITAEFALPGGGGNRSYVRNAGKSQIRGVELEVTAALTEQLTSGVTYSFIDSEFLRLEDPEALQLFGDASVAGNQMAGTPQQQAALWGKYTFPLATMGEAYVRADGTFTDRKYDQIYNLAHTGEKIVMNLSAGLDFDRWAFTVFVNNLTDDRTPSSIVRSLDQLNLNVPQYTNENPALNNVPGTTVTERSFYYPLAARRQVGASVTYRF